MPEPRFRNRDFKTPLSAGSHTWTTTPKNKPTQVFGPYVSSTSQWTGYKEEMTDVVTPGFRSLLEAGHIVNNAMYKVKETREGSGGDFDLSYTRANGERVTAKSQGGHGNQFSWPTPEFGIDVSNVVSYATTKALAGVVPPDAHNLVSLGELGKTMRMLRRPLSGLRDFILVAGSRAMRSRKFRLKLSRLTAEDRIKWANFRDWEKLVVATWLEARFGWRPFVYDTFGTIKALQRQYDEITQRRTSRGVGSEDDSATTSYTGANAWGGMSVQSGQIITQESATVRASVLYEHQLDLAIQMGVSLENIPASLVQLTTLSFVADWFVNLTQFARAITPKVGVKHLMTCYVLDRTSYVTRNVSVIGFSGWGSLVTCPIAESKTTMVRTIQRVPGLPLPALALVPNGLENVFSDWRTADIIALISALKSGGVRTFVQTMHHA